MAEGPSSYSIAGHRRNGCRAEQSVCLSIMQARPVLNTHSDDHAE